MEASRRKGLLGQHDSLRAHEGPTGQGCLTDTKDAVELARSELRGEGSWGTFRVGLPLAWQLAECPSELCREMVPGARQEGWDVQILERSPGPGNQGNPRGGEVGGLCWGSGQERRPL